jgi:hypothetical protein
MKLTNDKMLELTANMPMKQINITQLSPNPAMNTPHISELWHKPYLQRYYAGTFRDGSDLWLHRFLSNDGDRNLHSHPFDFETIMLCGGYTEEFIGNDGKKKFRETYPDPKSDVPYLMEEFLFQLKNNPPNQKPSSFGFIHSANFSRLLDVYDWHRIASVQNETWTAVIVSQKRLPKWFFKNDDGDIVDMVASPRKWWVDYGIRPTSGIAIDDNRMVKQ